MDKVILNGELIDKKDANISVFDKGYYFDFAVYSSVKVVQGKIFFPEYHVGRLFESASLIDLGHSFTEAGVLEWTNKLVGANGIVDGLLRMLLVGDAENNTEAKLYVFKVSGLTFYPKEIYRDGAKVITYSGERRVPKSKSKDLLMSFMAYREAKDKGALDALLIDHDGNIREGTRTNFFAIKENTIVTPPADKVLEGVTRKFTLAAVEGHYKVREENIPAAKLDEYDEFFITSTSMNVMPIGQIDEQPLTEHSKTKEIMRLFKEYTAKI